MPAREPYYQDDYVTLYHGDCREIVPQLGTFDLLLTDPPYGMSFRSNHRIVRYQKIVGDDVLPLTEIESYIGLMRVASYVFCRWDNLKDMPPPKSVIAWVKNNWSMGDLEHEHGRQWEACCFYPGPKHRFIKRPSDVICADRTGNELHPSEKPIELIAKLIACTDANTILDPFAGSGTTGRAAKDLWRKCTMIEIEERYCEIAARRCAQEVIPLEYGP